MLIVDSQGMVRAAGDSLARLLGVAAHDLAGWPVEQLLPDWRPSSAPRMRYRLRLPTVDSSIAVSLAWQPILEDGAQALFVVEVGTPSRRMALASEAIMVTDLHGVILYVNDSLEAMTGFRRQELLGSTPAVLKSGVHDARVYAELWRTILDGCVYHGVLVNRRRNGEHYREEKIIRPVHDAQGRPILFLACASEIDARRSRSAGTLHAVASP